MSDIRPNIIAEHEGDCTNYVHKIMARCFLLSSSICLLTLPVSAQTPSLDALRDSIDMNPQYAYNWAQKIEKKAISDSIRAEVLTIEANALLKMSQPEDPALAVESQRKDLSKNQLIAIDKHQKALLLRQQTFGQQSKEVAYSLVNLGNSFWENLHDGKMALPYYLQAIKLWETHKTGKNNKFTPWIVDDYDRFLFGNTHRVMADIYLLQRDFPLAQQSAEAATRDLATEKGEWLFAARLALIKSLFYNDRKAEALAQAEKMADLTLTLAHKAALYGAIADCLMDENAPQTDKALALNYYKKAVSFLSNKTENGERSKYLNKLGGYYLALEKKDSALFYFNNALNLLPNRGFSTLKSGYLTNIGNVYRQSKQFEAAQKYYELALSQASLTKEGQGEILDALTERAYAYADSALKEGHTPRAWQRALQGYEAAIQHLETYENQMLSAKSALILRGSYYPLFGGAAEACVHLKQAERALIWAERGKAFLLKAQSVLTLQDIQNQLVSGHKRFLIYSFGRHALTVFVVTKTQCYPLSINPENVAENVKKLFETIRTNPKNGHQNGDGFFHEEAQFLYEKLIAPTGLQAGEAVVIVPDGILHYLPFEVLLSEKPKAPTRFNQYAYLVKNHQISYQPSAFWTPKMDVKTAKIRSEILAFAPTFDGKQGGLSPLLHNQREVEAIEKVWATKILRGPAATKNAFVQQVERHRLVHISTHGIPNGDYPERSHLAFSADTINNGFFYLSEMDSLKLNADLVVLSACETAFGKYYGGEGPMSIARAFLAAGSKGVVASLWQVNDNLTTDLMTLFYQELKQGATVEAALQTAKKQFAEGEKANAAHPYFWAAFTFSGKSLENGGVIARNEATEGVLGARLGTWLKAIALVLTLLMLTFSLSFFYRRRNSTTR